MNETDTYGLHPSEELQRLFASHPYQGQRPDKAKLIVLGNDANYSAKISTHPFFKRIIEYHTDGIAFWRNNEDCVHHPFLLACYPFDKRKDGVRYHKQFACLGFTEKQAEHISFVELLHVPTTGNSSKDIDKFKNMLNRDYLCSLEATLLGGNKKLVLVNGRLLNSINYLSKKLNCFHVLHRALQGARVGTCVAVNNSCACYVGYHFSAAQIHGDISSMRQAIQTHGGF